MGEGDGAAAGQQPGGRDRRGNAAQQVEELGVDQPGGLGRPLGRLPAVLFAYLTRGPHRDGILAAPQVIVA